MHRTPVDASSLVERLVTTSATVARSITEIDTGDSETFADVVRSARAFASRLAEEGARSGDRVVLLVSPSIAWARAFFGVILAGGAVVAAPLAAPRAELEHLVVDSGARLAVAPVELAEVLPASLRRLDPPSAVPATASTLAGDPFVTSAHGTDPALVLYTSGTTGRPKGVVLTHDNLTAQTNALRAAWGFHEADVLLHTLPMHHLHGVVVAFLTSFTTPADIRVLRRFDAEQVLRQLSVCTVFMAVPTMYQRLVEHLDALPSPDRRAFERAARGLRLATSGSAALPARLAERWRAIGGSIPLERYGMTEIGIALSNPLDPKRRIPGTVGAPLPTVEARIVADDGTDSEGPGELFVRGPSVMVGYLGREDATREAFVEGWFKTGDVAVREASGAIRLLGRSSSDILKSGGEKVSALEVEEVLREHDAILEVAVVGLPDETWGDRVVAAVVVRPGREGDVESSVLRAWAKERLVAYKVPRAFVQVPALPRNVMGKVVKSALMEALISLEEGGEQPSIVDPKTRPI